MNSTSKPNMGLAAVDYDPFAAAALARVVPTTEPQREIWLANQLGREASLAYNESISLRFFGLLHTSALQQALQDVVRRHEALRSTISANGEELHIADDIVLTAGIADHSALSASEQDAVIAAAKQRVVETPFDVEHGPLFRVEVLKLAASDHLLIITAHHIVCDGWSFGVLVRDIAALYAARLSRSPAKLTPAASFGDYAVTQNASIGSEENVADEAYWLSQFSGHVPTLDFPTDRSRSASRTFTSRREDYDLDPELVAAVRKAGSRSGASLFSTLLGGFAALLHRVAGSEDIIVGVSAAGQSIGGLDNLVGHCVNMLPVRLSIRSSAHVQDVIAGTQTATLDAYEHQQYTFGTLLKKLSLARDASRSALVSVVFNIDQALDANTVGFPDVRVEFASNPRSYENFELFINAVQFNGALRLECQYNANLFDAATIRRWLDLYREALARLAADPAATVAELMAPAAGDRALLATWNATERVYKKGLRLGDLVQRGMRLNPAAPAVIFEGSRLSYGELDELSWQLALRLRELGAAPGVLIGVCLERSAQLITSLAGVIFSGGAYVPLDPTYPIDRLARMCEDAGLTVIVTRRVEYEKVKSAFPTNAKVVLLDEVSPLAATDADRSLIGRESDPAYVIFTSGSTGRPKGAMNGHKGIVNRLLWMQEAYGLEPADRVIQKTPYSFDVSVWEFFWPLMTGAAIVVARPDGHRDSAYLIELIRREKVTLMHFVPSMLRIFLDERDVEQCTSLRRVVCSGEALPFDVVENFFKRLPDVRLANLYGPTEAAVDVTAWECRPDHAARIVPIGKPIANTQMHVLDEQLRQVPVGVVGEMYIGGVQVGMGYVSRADLTAERFIADPFCAGGRLYKTGDIGRWRSDGSIEYMGRADYQVKIRGNRIELGEIEACLLSNPKIARAVVVPREDKPGDVRLVAYLVAQPEIALSDDELQGVLKAALPEYMIPQHFVTLLVIPLLSNGKVDRKALPAPDMSSRSKADFAEPRTVLEKAVATEMETSLGLPGIGVHDDFFALGGHSLLAAQLTSRLNRSFNTYLSMRTLFESPTVALLVKAIEAESATAPPVGRKSIARLTDQSRAPLSLMQERLWFLEELHPGRVTYHAPSAHRLKGRMDEAAFESAFREMVQRQPSLRSSFERDGNTVLQRIHDNIPVTLFPAEDLSGLAAHSREAKLRERLDELTAEIFDLTKVPLFRAKMFRLGEAEYALFFMPHHIIWDGWSFDLFYEEMSALYTAHSEQRPSTLPDLPISYGDFAAWHREWIESEEFDKQVVFWRERLEEIGKAEELPVDKPRRPGMSGSGSTEWIVIDKSKTDALHALARRADSTLFITMLSVYAVLLHAYAQQSNLVIGTPVRGRNSLELEGIMGYFNNLLPLQLEIDPGIPFTELVKRVKGVVMESLTYPDVPLEQLSQELSVKRGKGGSMLYQALFSFQDARQRVTQWGGLQHENILVFQRGATEDLGMWFVESPQGLHGGVTYNTDILLDATVQQLRKAFLAMLDAVVATPTISIATLSASLQREMRRPLADVVATPPEPKVLPVKQSAESAPATPSEKLLAEIWCSELKLPQVGTQDNFFDLGGHSLLAMQVMNVMEDKTGKRVNPRRFIFETLGQIAQAYDETKPEAVAKTGRMRRLLSRLVGAKDD